MTFGHTISIYQQTSYCTWSLSPRDEMKDLDVNASIWSIFFGHSSSCSSSWPKLLGKSGIYQVSTREVCETLVSSDLENDHWPNWNYWNYNDWKAAAYVERNDPADRQSCSVCNCKNLRLFWLSAKSGRYQYWTSHSMGQQDQMVFWKHVFFKKKTGSGRRRRMEFQWKNFPVFFTLWILDEIQKTMTTELKCEPQHFKRRIINVLSDSVLCVVKNGIWSCCNREEKILMVFGKQSLQGYESNRWYTDGVQVENIPKNHIVGPPREDSSSNDRLTVRTWRLHRQDHLHVNVQRHWVGSNTKKKTIHWQLQIMLANSLAVIGLSWCLYQKRSGAELTLANPSDDGQISQDLVTQHFELPVPLREGNYEAMEEARSQYTSMVVMKTSSCFTAQWFLRISSVSTEQ